MTNKPSPAPISRSARYFYGVCRVIAVGASRIVFPGTVENAEAVPATGAYVLAPVHRSYVDWLIVARVTRRRLRYIVKGEVWRFSLLGRFIELLGAFPVRRDAPDREAFDRALSVLSSGEPLVIFPEGTRRSGLSVEELKDGAAYLALRAGVPLVPVGLGGTEARMPRGRRFPRPGRIAIVVGTPILPPQERTARIARSAVQRTSDELRSALEEALGEAETGLESRTGRPSARLSIDTVVHSPEETTSR